MPLTGPNESDIAKLNAEINQIVNQRFLLATLAITIFGVFLSALVTISTSKPTESGATGIDVLIGSISSILSLVLFILFVMHQLLQGTLRVLSTYLIETKSSGWQRDWRLYRSYRLWDYIAPNTIVFLMTNGLILVFLLVIASVYPEKLNFLGHPFVASFSFTGAIEVLILVMTRLRVLENEKWSEIIWKNLNSE